MRGINKIYFLVLILLVVGIIVFSTNNIFLSPKSIQENTIAKETITPIDKDILLNKELTEKDKTILTDTLVQKNIQTLHSKI